MLFWFWEAYLKLFFAAVFLPAFIAIANFNLYAQDGAAAAGADLGAANSGAAASASDLPWNVPPETTAQQRAAALIEERQAIERTQSLGDGGSSGGGTIGFFSVLRVFFSLAVVALAIYGIVYFLKYGKRKAQTNNLYLKLLASIPLTPKTAAAVISVGNKAWLAGISESQVSLLAEINDQELIDTMILDYAQNSTAAEGARSFFSLIEKYIPRRPAERRGTEADSGANINLNALRSHRERLK